MNLSETVTLFNDLCLLAPGALIDRERIQWEDGGSASARARFTVSGVTIGAQLSFNAAGELTGFLSPGRFLSADGKTFQSYPWSTPVRSYRDLAGRNVMSYGEYCYGRFHLGTLEYNLSARSE
jgi:hypothetical protein